MWVVYNNGVEWGSFDTEEEARNRVANYDGEHEVWCEEVCEYCYNPIKKVVKKDGLNFCSKKCAESLMAHLEEENSRITFQP